MGPQTDEIRRLFTRIAGRYDLLNRALTFGLDLSWRRRALALLEAPTRVLDLATGTGDLALGLARRFPRARVTGLDLTPAMLAIARRRIARAGCAARVAFMEGDATRLPFADGAFDTVTCAFGFRNFPDPAAALAEAARVLVPGGTLLVLEFFRPASRVCAAATSAWLRLVAPLAAAPGTRADYAYLRTSIARMCPASAFAGWARAVGLSLSRAAFYLPACHCLVFRKDGAVARPPAAARVALNLP